MQQRQARKTIIEAMRRQAINENYNQLSQPDKLFVNCAANTIYNRLMSKAIIQNTQLTASRVFQGKTDPSDKSNNCWQCSTDNSDERLSFEEISILEESTSNINSEFQYNFKKSKPGENSQLRVSIASNIEKQENIKLPKTKNSFFSYHKDIAQLELIEKKTEQLAMKERKQRKQLKKLKQMLVEHQEQMKSKQFSFQIEKTELMNTIDQLRQNQASLISEKDTIDEKLKNLLVQLKQTKDETTKFKIQKEKLLRHLQFLQANLDNTLSVNNQNQTMRKDSKNRIQQMVEDITELDEIEKEIEIVDSLITRLKKNAHNEQDCEKLLGFYELRSKYVEKRQCLRINKSNKRYQTIIFKLNRIIFNRNQEIDSFIQNHGQRQQENYDKSLVQTSDSFFSKCQIQKNKLYCNKRQSIEKLDQLALKITNIIQANTIKEYEEIYENIDNIALSTIYLRNIDDNQSKYLDCLQKSVLEISSCIASKAQRNYQKIRLLMAVIDSQSNAKIKTKYKEAKVQN